jgi:radical SAM superfamily enzyme with C-terminal helix-hairpin-helix motif
VAEEVDEEAVEVVAEEVDEEAVEAVVEEVVEVDVEAVVEEVVTTTTFSNRQQQPFHSMTMIQKAGVVGAIAF